MVERDHLTEEQIAVYAEALLEGKENSLPEEWRYHVSECDLCSQEIAMVSQIQEEEAFAIGHTQETGKKPLFAKITGKMGVAATVSLLVAGGVILTLLNWNQIVPPMADTSQGPALADTIYITDTDTDFIAREEKKEVKQKKTHPAPKEQEEKKEGISVTDKLAYATYEPLENLVSRFENSSFRGADVEVISSTRIKLPRKNTPTLQWKTPGDHTLIVELYNNQGKRIFETQTSDESFEATQLKEPGVYYWKLLNEDFDLLFCGRIVIEEK